MQTAELVKHLLKKHGTLFSEELGIDLAQNTPSHLFRWLCAALLLSARIPHGTAMKAAKALADAGMTTARTMAEATWKDRVGVLAEAGYGRFDESTSRMLGETARLIEREYGGDLRQLREDANRDPKAEHAALKACKGIGDMGVDIFLREIQQVWTEHYPYIDEKARTSARQLGLPETVEDLAKLVDQGRFATLVAALVRADFTGTTARDLGLHEPEASER